MQPLCLNRTGAALRCAPPLYPTGVTFRRGGRGVAGGEVARGASRCAQANTDLQWKALGSRSRPPPRVRGHGEGGLSMSRQHPACWGLSRSRLRGEGQDLVEARGMVRTRMRTGVRLIIKHGGLDVMSRMGNP